jgi:phage baseplate assembly protein V
MRTPEDSETDADNLVRLGTIASVDLAAARCVVSLADGVETPPVRWMESRMGAVRIWSPPSEGEQVLLLCPAGEISGGIAVRGIPSDAFPVPTNAPDLTHIEFPDGAAISYDHAAHALLVTLPAGGTATLNVPSGVFINGPVEVNGDVIITGTATASEDVVGGGKSLKSHMHGGVQAGSAQTGAPA